MGGTAPSVEGTRLIQAEVAIDSQPDIGGVGILLPVVLPPADRTERQCAGRLQRLQATARAAKASLQDFPRMNGRKSTAPGLRWRNIGPPPSGFRALRSGRQAFSAVRLKIL